MSGRGRDVDVRSGVVTDIVDLLKLVADNSRPPAAAEVASAPTGTGRCAGGPLAAGAGR